MIIVLSVYFLFQQVSFLATVLAHNTHLLPLITTDSVCFCKFNLKSTHLYLRSVRTFWCIRKVGVIKYINASEIVKVELSDLWKNIHCDDVKYLSLCWRHSSEYFTKSALPLRHPFFKRKWISGWTDTCVCSRHS